MTSIKQKSCLLINIKMTKKKTIIANRALGAKIKLTFNFNPMIAIH